MAHKERGRLYLPGRVEGGGDSNSRMLRVSKGTLVFTDITATDLFVIPANADIVGITIDVTEAFDDSGTDLIDLGKTGTATHFKDDLDVSSTGQTVSGWTNLGDVGTSDIMVIGTYIEQNSDAAAGAASIYVFWLQD